MPDKKLTPMMELIEWSEKKCFHGTIETGEEFHIIDFYELKTKIAELLEKERQMVIDSHERAYIDMNLSFRAGERAEQYYTQTYKS